MASRDEVMAALGKVAGPDGKTPLPQSGAISGVTTREGKVFLAIVVDPKQADALEPMRARAEAAIKALPGVTGAVVTLTAESAREVASAPPAHGAGQPAPHGRRATQPIPGV